MRIRKKSATFTARLMPETRAALEAAAQASGKSLGQELEERLKESLAGSRLGLDKQPDHIQALVALVVLLTEQIEAASGLSWRSDQGTGEALAGGLRVIVYSLGPSWPLLQKTPGEIFSWVKKIVGDRSDNLATMYIRGDRPPNVPVPPTWGLHFGAFTAAGLVYHLARPEAVPPSLSEADVARLAWIREKLASGIPPDPREWAELVRVAQEEFEAMESAFTKDAEKKS